MVKKLIEKTSDREHFKSHLVNYDCLNNISKDSIWATYIDVIPHIGKSGIDTDNLSQDLKNVLIDLRVRYLEEVAERKIQDLQSRLDG